MGQFDKQIKQALKIGEEWKKKSQDYEAQLITLKKNNMKWEKDTVTGLQKQIQRGEHVNPDTAKAIDGEIDTIKERLKEFRAEADRLHKAHDKWSLSEPRNSMATLDKKLKLGGSSSEAYKAVTDGIKRQLTDVAGQISQTQRAHADVIYALDIMEDRVKGLIAVVREGKGKSQAWMAQIKSEAKTFIDSCKHVLDNYGIMAQILADIRDGKKDNWEPKVVKQQLQLAEAKEALAPKLIAQIEKNHNRVIKSVPKQFIDGFMTSGEKKAMEKAKTDTILTVQQRQKFWKLFVKTMKEHPPFKAHV